MPIYARHLIHILLNSEELFPHYRRRLTKQQCMSLHRTSIANSSRSGKLNIWGKMLHRTIVLLLSHKEKEILSSSFIAQCFCVRHDVFWFNNISSRCLFVRNFIIRQRFRIHKICYYFFNNLSLPTHYEVFPFTEKHSSKTAKTNIYRMANKKNRMKENFLLFYCIYEFDKYASELRDKKGRLSGKAFNAAVETRELFRQRHMRFF